MTMVQLQVCDNQERGSRANNPHIMDETIAALEAFFASPINIFVILLIILMLCFFGGSFGKFWQLWFSSGVVLAGS